MAHPLAGKVVIITGASSGISGHAFFSAALS